MRETKMGYAIYVLRKIKFLSIISLIFLVKAISINNLTMVNTKTFLVMGDLHEFLHNYKNQLYLSLLEH